MELDPAGVRGHAAQVEHVGELLDAVDDVRAVLARGAEPAAHQTHEVDQGVGAEAILPVLRVQGGSK